MLKRIFHALLLIGAISVVDPTALFADTLPSVHVPIVSSSPKKAAQKQNALSWARAAVITLAYDFTNRRVAKRPTLAYVEQDATGLDITFRVEQTSPVVASTRSNGPGVFGDDYVLVALEPQGVQGFAYQFVANARGARFQTSTENSAYTPQWTATGRRTKNGYVVTMHIPFAIIRSNASHVWTAQFERFSVHSNSVDVWSYDRNATNAADPLYSGKLYGVETAAAAHHTVAPRPAARFQPYLLGVARSTASGGATSQVGLDMAVPITPTASFVGSFHPDYSNVEVDQQSISPTAFPRQYQEVRPFFTQLDNAFNNTAGCAACPQTLYTPAIPTFRQGYGVEGTQGPVTFAGFDAVGTQRTDVADVVNVARTTKRWSGQLELQRVAVDTPNFLDTTSAINGGISSARGHWLVYGNYAREGGTFVSDPSQARYGEIGAAMQTATTEFLVARQFVGAQFNPVDGYEAQSDIGGYFALAQRTYHFSKTSPLLDVNIFGSTARYWNHNALPAQSNASYQINIDWKSLWSVHLFQQSQFVLASNGEFLPFNVGNGVDVGYNLNSNFSKSLMYADGAYYHGHASAWQFSDTMPVRKKLSLSINMYENLYQSNEASEPSFREWLNDVNLNWQFSRDASLSLGARRINGINLPTYYAPPNFTPMFADNLSAAFHYLHGHNEFYLVYGDPNAFTTTPAVFFKWIFYAGAGKGS